MDNLKDAGFYWATRSGVTVAISDITSNMDKATILAPYEEKAAKVQASYDKGLIADTERRQDLIDIWTKATDEVAEAMKNGMEELNTINRMVTSKARGNYLQLHQIAGIRGLVSNLRVKLFLARLSLPTVKACRFWSTSLQLTVPVRVWLIPHLKTANSGLLDPSSG